MLDSLESAGFSKLCIFVCNRYGLPERLGRYLVSIANDYSLLSHENLAVNKNTLLPCPQRVRLLERAVVSSLALHTVLELVNPSFFELKSDLENFLGGDCVTGLVLLGMYKKAAFMLGIRNSLSLLYCFSEANMYTEIFRTKHLSQI